MFFRSYAVLLGAFGLKKSDPICQAPRSTHSCKKAPTFFLRCDRVRRPLEPPYDGPYPVLSRSDKTFKISMNGRHETVSIDRLKSASVEEPFLNSVPIRNPSELTGQPNDAIPPGNSSAVPPARINPEPPDALTTSRTRSGRVSRTPLHLTNFAR